MATWSELLRRDRPLVVAHRGYAARYPENTRPSFEAATRVGAEAIELDVQLTRDRVPIVLHDDTLERTTNGHGRADLQDADALLALDAGASFAEDFAGTRIPRLEAVLDQLGGRVALDVELKSSTGKEPVERPDGIEAQVLGLLSERPRLRGQVLISSFDVRLLERLRALDADLPLGLLVDRISPVAETLAQALALGASMIGPDAEGLEARDVDALLTEDFAVFPWTLDDTPTMGRWLSVGVDGFFSNEVELALSVVEAM